MTKHYIKILKLNNTWGRIVSDDISILNEIYYRFTVPVDNYWHMPAYKSGRWDGKIRFVTQDGKFYIGLLSKILKFVKGEEDYNIEIDDELKVDTQNIDDFKKDFIDITNKTMTNMDPYFYQIRGAMKALYKKRAICEHATGSGKSYTICLVCNYLLHKNPKNKILILVPKLDLIEQLTEEFTERYGLPEDLIGKYCGFQKDTEQPIIISTWQSCYKQPKLLKTFDVLIADEAHGLKSEMIRSVAEKSTNATIRIGFTGTMPEGRAEKLLVEGVLGPVVDQILYKELVELKAISDLEIKVIKINYSQSILEKSKGIDYQLEKEFCENDRYRNKVICSIANGISLKKKNCLVLVKKIEHGKQLQNDLEALGCKVDFICGEMKINDRTDIRQGVENDEGRIIVATTGVFSTGISIKKLHSVIFAAAGKSKIQTLQSVGRGLRLHPTKNKLILYDVSENLYFSERHLNKRLQYYNNNEFNVEIKEVTADAKIH
jgi:superfamily II DNA or RNA helicase